MSTFQVRVTTFTEMRKKYDTGTLRIQLSHAIPKEARLAYLNRRVVEKRAKKSNT